MTAQALRVLIVEDAEDDALLLIEELQTGGYAVDWERVESAEALREALDSGSWEVIISDYNLPHFTGIEALQIVRERGVDVPFIIVSGTIGEDLAVATMKAGAHDYIMKANLTRLVPAVDRELHEAVERRNRRDAEKRYRALFHASPVGIELVNADGFLTETNTAFEDMLGYDPGELIGRHWTAITHPEDASTEAALDREMDAGTRTRHQLVKRLVRKDGEAIWARLSSSDVGQIAEGDFQFTIGMVEDITEQKRAQDALARSEARYRQMFEGNHAIKLLVDPESGAIVDANPAAAAFYGYPLDTLRTMTIGQINTLPADELRSALAAVNAQEASHFVFVHRLASGEVRDVEVHSSPVEVAGRTHLYSIIHDVTDRRRAEEALSYRAWHDALTDLPNRALLHDRLQQAIRSARRRHRTLALLVIDLTGLKEVSATFGYQVGDALLRQIGPCLQGVLRESDTVARLEGGEFGVLLSEVDETGARMVAAKIMATLQHPVMVDAQEFCLDATVGVALYPVHAREAAALIQHAGVAMDLAKQQGTGLALYDPQEDAHTPARFALSVELRQAIEREQLCLHYQPQADLRTGRVEHVEALLRWPHPVHGFIPPDQFIPLAERTGLTGRLTHWVIQQALEQFRSWQDGGLDIRVSVNLSARDLHDPHLPDTVLDMLRGQTFAPDRLVIELTESAAMADPFRAIGILTRLHEAGVGLAIDDFGTGYSSLAYLKRLPVDEIKIDRSFVADMATNENDARIVRATIGLGHELGLRSVAEGVEDRETHEHLVHMGCDLIQGYYLSRPLPADECTSWLRRHQEEHRGSGPLHTASQGA